MAGSMALVYSVLSLYFLHKLGTKGKEGKLFALAAYVLFAVAVISPIVVFYEFTPFKDGAVFYVASFLIFLAVVFFVTSIKKRNP